MISKQEVQHIAKLARLDITEKEQGKFQKDLSSVLGYFKSLKQVDVSKVEPTFHPAEHFFERKLGIMREDKPESQPVEVVNKLIEVVPEKKNRYVKVRSILS